jgi:hypothetical protein
MAWRNPRALLLPAALGAVLAGCGQMGPNQPHGAFAPYVPPQVELRPPDAPAIPVPRSAALSWREDPACVQDPARRPAQPVATRGEIARDCPRTNRDFIALGMSGGGVKAAIFSAEAMFYLDALGLLRRVALLSSVSGSSYAAGYYALSCDPADAWCREGQLEGGLRRPVWQYGESMAVLGSGFRSQLYRGAANVLLVPFRAEPIRAEEFARFIDSEYFGGGAGGERFTFRHLNPRRPALALNSTLLSGTRQLAEATRGLGYLRRRYPDELLHFAFTDYFFHHIGSDLGAMPLGYGVAASSAFPVLVGYAHLRNHRFCQQLRQLAGAATDCTKHAGYWLTLTDGGANDNQGLIELSASVAELVANEARSDLSPLGQRPHPSLQKLGRGDRALLLALNSSITEATGLGLPASMANRNPTLSAFLGTVERALAAVDVYSAGGADLRRRLYLSNAQALQQQLDAQRLDIRVTPLEVGLITLDRYAQGGAELARRVQAGLIEMEPDGRLRLTKGAPAEQTTQEIADAAKWQPVSWRRLSHRPVRQQLALGSTHPQCLFEQAKIAERGLFSLAEMNPGNATCLRRAARWAMALRAEELCLRGDSALADRSSFCRDGQLAALGGSWRETLDTLGECDLSRASTGNTQAEDDEVVQALLTNPWFRSQLPDEYADLRGTDAEVRRTTRTSANLLPGICAMP